MNRRYCLALDLKDDPQIIAEYEAHHRNVWPEILDSIRRAGVLAMDIYRVHTRLVMVMEVDADFTFERKAAMDLANPRVQDWETLMWKYQQGIPGGAAGVKWQLMQPIFHFASEPRFAAPDS